MIAQRYGFEYPSVATSTPAACAPTATRCPAAKKGAQRIAVPIGPKFGRLPVGVTVSRKVRLKPLAVYFWGKRSKKCWYSLRKSRSRSKASDRT